MSDILRPIDEEEVRRQEENEYERQRIRKILDYITQDFAPEGMRNQKELDEFLEFNIPDELPSK